jgi:hypothetical protein
MQFFDAITMDGVRHTADGYLVANAKVARTGIQLYRGSELGRPDLDIVKVYRDEKEVFAGDAMTSFAHKPVSLDHPPELVSSDSWRDHAVGFTSGDIARDGDFLRVPLMLADADAIKQVQNGSRQLSAGYTCDILFEPGTTPDGQEYQARQVGIRANHIAVVANGRAGPECRIGDAHKPTDFSSTDKELAIMPDTLRTVQVDGISIAVTDQGLQAIEKLQRQLADAAQAAESKEGQFKAVRDAHQSELAKKDGEIAALRAAQDSAVSTKDGEIDALKSAHESALAAKDGEIAALKVQIPDAEAIDTLIAEREKVIVSAKKLMGDSFDPKGQSVESIKRTAVTKRLGDQQVAGRDDSYIAAAFDTLSAIGAGAPAKDPLRVALATGPVISDSAPTPYQQSVERLRNAWKGAH